MKTKSSIIFVTLSCAIHAGCAGFDHQTTEREPHALVTVAKSAKSSASRGTLKSLDRLPVKAGETYRLRPGRHVVVVEFMESSIEAGRPRSLFANPPDDEPAEVSISASGSVSTNGVQPFGVMQPVNLTVEQRRRKEVSRSIIVQAGKHYRLVGDRFMPCHVVTP